MSDYMATSELSLTANETYNLLTTIQEALKTEYIERCRESERLSLT